ncbi:unnamed protein product, partial [Staurois parvus]
AVSRQLTACEERRAGNLHSSEGTSAPPVSVHQCHLSVLIHATCQCPISATFQCPSVPHISAHLSGLSVSPISASQCHLSVPVNAAYQFQLNSASQCHLTVPVSAAYQCHLS